MKVFLTGATGLVGRNLIVGLLEQNHAVVAMSRNQQRAAEILPDGVEIIEGNPVIPGEWQEALADCDGVVNLAGDSVGDGLWTSKKKRRIRRSRLSTTFNIAHALEERDKPAVLVNASATGYYGDAGAVALNEESESGQGFLARLACEWEHTALQAESEDVRVVLLRVGVVLARDGGALPRMLKPFRWGLGGPMGNGRQYFPWIHIDDLVRVILFALEQPEMSGPVNACVPNPPMQKEFATALGQALDKSARMPLPGFLLRMILGEKADIVLSSQRVIPNVLKAAGFKFKYSEIEDALADLC